MTPPGLTGRLPTETLGLLGHQLRHRHRGALTRQGEAGTPDEGAERCALRVDHVLTNQVGLGPGGSFSNLTPLRYESFGPGGGKVAGADAERVVLSAAP